MLEKGERIRPNVQYAVDLHGYGNIRNPGSMTCMTLEPGAVTLRDRPVGVQPSRSYADSKPGYIAAIVNADGSILLGRDTAKRFWVSRYQIWGTWSDWQVAVEKRKREEAESDERRAAARKRAQQVYADMILRAIEWLQHARCGTESITPELLRAAMDEAGLMVIIKPGGGGADQER